MRSEPTPSTAWSGPYLIVDGAPFPVVGAEVHNSSSSSRAAIAESFGTVRRFGANTVLAPVAWDLFEPREGEYDFTLIDAMITMADTLGMKLIPLWFGSWKNAASTYVPAWIKTDLERFPRSVLADGSRIEHLTPFGAGSRIADARAFAALMARIRDVDTRRTVIAVQVENEIGLLGASRDHSELAQAAFDGPVPESVIAAIAADPSMPLHAEWQSAGAARAGSWHELFPAGDRADEAFMAAAFSSYTQDVAAAGAAQHDVPLFVNAWLDADSVLDGPVALAGGKRPGDYPSGGPVIPVAAIWEALAPALAFLAVDVYVEDADPVFAAYRSRRGRLFVPELRADEPGVTQMFSAFGIHAATGVSPFGVDSLDPDSEDSAALRDAFTLLNAASHVLRTHPQARLHGFVFDERTPTGEITIGEVTVHMHTTDEWGMVTPVYPGYGVAVEDGEGGLYIIGRGFWITMSAVDGRKPSFLFATAFTFEDGQLSVSRELNGDETASGTLIPFPFAGGGLLPGRAIPTRIPDTGIVRIRPYTY